LALHTANLAVASGAANINLIGHSRGAVQAIMAAWFIYAYGSRDLTVNIFAIDPVPGTGEWYGILTQLAPNVRNYVGIYSWDMGLQPADKPFMALVPRPNMKMLGLSDGKETVKLGSTWDALADNYQQVDPLEPGPALQPQGYELFACRGRHSTVAGNSTADSGYNPDDVSDSAPELRRRIHTDPFRFDAMGGGATRTSTLAYRPYVRRLSSISGRNPFNSYYMDNVVGDPPYRLAYPVTSERSDSGRVAWKFL
jgi:hypothetical protein